MHLLQVLLSIFLLTQLERQQLSLNWDTVLVDDDHVSHIFVSSTLIAICSCYCHLSIECNVPLEHNRLAFIVHKLYVFRLLQELLLLLKVQEVLCKPRHGSTLSLVAILLLLLLMNGLAIRIPYLTFYDDASCLFCFRVILL